MLSHEAEERKTQTPLERRRELSRMSKPDLIPLVMRLEATDREDGSRDIADS